MNYARIKECMHLKYINRVQEDQIAKVKVRSSGLQVYNRLSRVWIKLVLPFPFSAYSKLMAVYSHMWCAELRVQKIPWKWWLISFIHENSEKTTKSSMKLRILTTNEFQLRKLLNTNFTRTWELQNHIHAVMITSLWWKMAYKICVFLH